MGGFVQRAVGFAAPKVADSPIPPGVPAPKAVEDKVNATTPSALLVRRLPDSTANSAGVGMLTQPRRTQSNMLGTTSGY